MRRRTEVSDGPGAFLQTSASLGPVTWVTWPASLLDPQPAINSLVSTDETALCCSGSSKLHWFSLDTGELLLLFHFLPLFP